MRTIIVLGCAALLACASSACTDKSETAAPAPSASPAPTPKAETPPPAAPASAAPSAAAPAAQKVELAVASVGNLMAFDKTKLSVPTGALVHVTFTNKGTQDVMQHNWVLVNKGKEASVAAEGLAKAPDAGYIVPGPDVLAYTALTKPGGTAETTFTAPAPGNYPYICTFPGHYIMMKGVLTVTP
jgi:azurin